MMPHRQIGGEILKRGRSQAVFPAQKRVVGLSERSSTEKGGDNMDRSRTSAVGGLIFAVGVIAGLLGYVGDVYSSSIATVLMLGIWVVGGALAALLLRGK
jgi:hypothetical protein